VHHLRCFRPHSAGLSADDDASLLINGRKLLMLCTWCGMLAGPGAAAYSMRMQELDNE
jgi:hypothetical protein